MIDDEAFFSVIYFQFFSLEMVFPFRVWIVWCMNVKKSDEQISFPSRFWF